MGPSLVSNWKGDQYSTITCLTRLTANNQVRIPTHPSLVGTIPKAKAQPFENWTFWNPDFKMSGFQIFPDFKWSDFRSPRFSFLKWCHNFDVKNIQNWGLNVLWYRCCCQAWLLSIILWTFFICLQNCAFYDMEMK